MYLECLLQHMVSSSFYVYDMTESRSGCPIRSNTDVSRLDGQIRAYYLPLAFSSLVMKQCGVLQTTTP